MANIRWSGIESFKYGLTARWYVSAYYGNDVDVDAVGYYNPSTNASGHGGPTRPFATRNKIMQDATVVSGSVVVYDSGYYSSSTYSKLVVEIGDGIVIFSLSHITSMTLYNIVLMNYSAAIGSNQNNVIDCIVLYCTNFAFFGNGSKAIRTIFIESTFYQLSPELIDNCIFIRCSSAATVSIKMLRNSFFVNCGNLILNTYLDRVSGTYCDYSIIIGTVKSTRTINGKTTGVTIEDFKIDGKYFVKSFSEVDLFGNASGSGASVAQLQTIFNNYLSPIYLDTWQDVDLSLKTTASDIVKFGGLNGTYIGALPVGYRFSASSLYNTYIDAVNSSNLAWDAVNSAIVIATGFDTAVYRSIRISLSQPIIVDPINFFANLVYNNEGAVRQGVANQRIDTTPDLEPNNTLNQRVVYDYKLAYSPNNVDALSAFKNFELNNVPYVDNEGESMLNDNYDSSERQRITIQDFMIEFTLRKIVIE